MSPRSVPNGKLSNGASGQVAIPPIVAMLTPSAVAACPARIPTISLSLLCGRHRRPSLMPTEKRRAVREKPRRFTPRLAVQVTNTSNLPSVISEVRITSATNLLTTLPRNCRKPGQFRRSVVSILVAEVIRLRSGRPAGHPGSAQAPYPDQYDLGNQ